MRLDYKSPEALSPIVESLLFASDEPLSAIALRGLILGDDLNKIAAEEAEMEKQEAEAEAAAAEDAAAEATAAAATAAAQANASTNGEIETPATVLEVSAPVLEDAPIAAGPTEEAAIDGMPIGVDAPQPEKKRKKRQLIELVTIHVAVQHLNSLYEQDGRAFKIVEIAGGYQFATRAEYSEYVARLSKEKSRRRLSGASLETLAIVAYKQPVSKLDIENIRGVNCDEVLKSLLEKNLVTITGRAEAVGRPLLYGTTTDFLRHFGLHDLGDLPRPREIEELMKEESVRATTLDEAASEFTPEGEQTEGMTIDAAVAMAHQLEEMEDTKGPQAIELDEESFANPGHGEAIEIEATEIEVDATEIEVDATEIEVDATEIEVDATEIEVDATEIEVEVVAEDSDDAE